MKNKIGTFVVVAVAVMFTGIGLVVAAYALTVDGSSDALNSKETTTTDVRDNKHQHDDHDHGTDNKTLQASSDPSVVIEYQNGGFAQSSYTVPAGEIVQVKNLSDSDMYFTTGDHHNHDIHSPLNLGVVKAGAAAEFAAPEAGVYQFHNHDNEVQAGELIVQ